MSSRFVSAGTDEAPTQSDHAWAKAKQTVESHREVKHVDSGKREDGKSLYEVLQANKAAKQDAFEEAAKLRNQFRALDDSEIEFLDSIRESERTKENSVRQETAQQLDLFRKQQSAAEQKEVEVDETPGFNNSISPKKAWATSKKRRRDKAEADVLPSKARKASTDEQIQDRNLIVSIGLKATSPSSQAGSKDNISIAAEPRSTEAREQPKSAGLDLSAYDSDDD